MNNANTDRRTFLKEAGMTALAVAGGMLTQPVQAATPTGQTSMDAGQVSAPRMAIPKGSCDCHVHVFEPDQYPYTLPRTYTPGTASVDMLNRFESTLGIERVVLVQPSSYGTDNRCLVDALRRLGPERARAIAVVDLEQATQTDLKALHQAGVRGIRLNLEVKGERNAHVVAAALKQAEALVADLGWSIQIFAEVPLIAALSEQLASLKVPVILDHFGGIKTEHGLEQPGFAALLSLLKSDKVYIKLSAPYRISKHGPDYADVTPFAQALIAVAPHRMLWASDWPHTGSSANRTGDLSKIEPFRKEDSGHTLGLLQNWAPDAATRQQILVDNPAKLFGFLS